MPCNDPSSHPTAKVASSGDMAKALIGDFGFLSLGHLQTDEITTGSALFFVSFGGVG